MYPHERSLVKQLANYPFAIIGVNSDRDREKIREVVEEKSLTWRSFWNESGSQGRISDAWYIRGWPTIYLIDANGVIRFKQVRGEALDQAILSLLDEMGHQIELKDHQEFGKIDESGP